MRQEWKSFNKALLLLPICVVLAPSCQQGQGRHYHPSATDNAKPVQEVTGPVENAFLQAGLMDIGAINGVLVDLKYSSTDNFMQMDMYGGLEKAYLLPDAAHKLERAARALLAVNPDLRLLVYDGARPHYIQQLMWDSVDLPPELKINFLSHPDQLSLHNYGAAIDLTLSDASGHPLDMGTGYDDPARLSYPSLEATFLASGELSASQVANRQLLRRLMTEAGFTGIDSEWWHFNHCTRAYAAEHYQLIP
jgi:D-alanyl-D-alanine dipeptidase